MFAWQATVQDESGNAVPLPVVTVYLKGTETLAAIYAEDEVTPLSNPLTGTMEGFVQFWANAGQYTIVGSSGSAQTQEWGAFLDTPLADAVAVVNAARDVTIANATLAFNNLTALTAFLTANGAQGNGTVYSTRTEGFAYTEQATSPDVTLGGVGLVLANDVTDATAVGAPNAADPSGRGLFAPSLVASMEQRKNYGVTMRDLLGTNYAGTVNGAPTLNSFIPELAAGGIKITDPNALTVLCEEPVRLVDDMKMYLGGTFFKKGYSVTSEAATSLFSKSNWATACNNIEMYGFKMGVASETQRGKLFSIWGDNWHLGNIEVDQYHGGQAFLFGGTEFSIKNVTGGTTDTEAGTGFMRCLFGENGLIQNCHKVYCGDDLYQLVPAGGTGDPHLNKHTNNVWYIGCTGQSYSARVLIAALEADDAVVSMTSKIQNSGFISSGGKGGNRTFGVLNQEGAGGANQMDGIYFIGCLADGSTDELTNSGCVQILANSTKGGGVGTVVMDKCAVVNVKQEIGVAANFAGQGGTLVLRDSIVEGESSAVQILTSGGGDLVIEGGRMTVVSGGGGHGANHVILDSGASHVTARDVEITGIATGKSAFRAAHSASKHDLRNVKAKNATGASNTRLSSNVVGSVVYVEDPRGDYDSLDDGGYVRMNPLVGNAGNVILRSSTTATLSSAYIGKINNLQSGSAITLTVPTNATAPLPNGIWIDFCVAGAGGVTITGTGVSFKGSTSIAAGGWFSLMKLSSGGDTWIIRS